MNQSHVQMQETPVEASMAKRIRGSRFRDGGYGETGANEGLRFLSLQAKPELVPRGHDKAPRLDGTAVVQ